METRFFERPILNSPYEYPSQYWEFDETGQPTNRVADRRRHVWFITPIPKPKEQEQRQQTIVFDGPAEGVRVGRPAVRPGGVYRQCPPPGRPLV